MTSGRRKAHHTHEVTDAYAEGWDARRAWRRGSPEPENPYENVPEALTRKRSEARRELQSHDAVLWREGWVDCGGDLAIHDLVDVTPADFVRAPVVGLEPIEDVPEDEEID